MSLYIPETNKIDLSAFPAVNYDQHRRNPEFIDWQDEENGREPNVLPPRAILGPHSDKLAKFLKQYELTCEFATGVDERLVFSSHALPLGEDCYDWFEENDGHPLVFAIYRPESASYEVACVKAWDISSRGMDQTLHIEIHVILTLFDNPKGMDAILLFPSRIVNRDESIDTTVCNLSKSPTEFRDNVFDFEYEMFEHIIKCDLFAIDDLGIDTNDSMSWIKFVVNAIGDPITHYY